MRPDVMSVTAVEAAGARNALAVVVVPSGWHGPQVGR